MATQTATRPMGAVSDSDNAAKGGKTEEPKKKSKKKLIIILVILLVVGGVGYKMFGSKSAPPKTPPPPKPGVVVAMTDTTLNLTDGHFLKIKLGLQTVVGAPADLDTSKASDLMISEFTGQTMAAISTADGRNKLKADLLTKIEAAYPKEIMDIYFTEFVMQ
jgi:flagellar FliL protein